MYNLLRFVFFFFFTQCHVQEIHLDSGVYHFVSSYCSVSRDISVHFFTDYFRSTFGKSQPFSTFKVSRCTYEEIV